MTRYKCVNCGDECDVSQQDIGIGAYEYWGFKGVDRNIQTLSTCCGGYVTEATETYEEEDHAA